ANDVAAGCARCGEEPLVEVAPEAAAAVVGPDADEVDVRLVAEGLREEAAEEADHLAVLLRDEARVAEVLEEEAREHRPHSPAAPPRVEMWRDTRVVAGLGMSDRDHRERLFHIRRDSVTDTCVGDAYGGLRARALDHVRPHRAGAAPRRGGGAPPVGGAELRHRWPCRPRLPGGEGAGSKRRRL